MPNELTTFDPKKSALAKYDFKVVIQKDTLLVLGDDQRKLLVNVFQNSEKTWTASPYDTNAHIFIQSKTFPTAKEALDHAVARTVKYIEEGV